MYSFPSLEPIHCYTSRTNYCFLACIQISQEAGKVVWYSHLLKNFPQFVVIHTVKSFGIVNKSEVDVFLELSHFFYDPVDVGIWSLVPLPFLNSAWISKFSVHILLKPGLENFEHYFASVVRWWQLSGSLSIFWHCLSLGLEWKLTFSSPVATAEFSKFAGILSAVLFFFFFNLLFIYFFISWMLITLQFFYSIIF